MNWTDQDLRPQFKTEREGTGTEEDETEGTRVESSNDLN